jgi:hypothetical protein
MKDSIDSFIEKLLKENPKVPAPSNKIVSFDEEAAFLDLINFAFETEELENFHPLFSECTLLMTLIIPLSYMALALPEFKKHRKIIQKAESKHRIEDPLSPIFESYFTMWTLFDLEIGKTGKVLTDLAISSKMPLDIDKYKLSLIERMKMSYTGVYLCEEKSEESFKLKEIPSGKSIEAILEPVWDEEIEKGDILMIRLIENTQDGTHVQLSSPYVVNSTEDDWIEFFAEHGIDQGQSFDLEKYREFMKRGISPDFWLSYIDSACLSVNDMVVTLEGTPLLSVKSLKGAKRL